MFITMYYMLIIVLALIIWALTNNTTNPSGVNGRYPAQIFHPGCSNDITMYQFKQEQPRHFIISNELAPPQTVFGHGIHFAVFSHEVAGFKSSPEIERQISEKPLNIFVNNRNYFDGRTAHYTKFLKTDLNGRNNLYLPSDEIPILIYAGIEMSQLLKIHSVPLYRLYYVVDSTANDKQIARDLNFIHSVYGRQSSKRIRIIVNNQMMSTVMLRAEFQIVFGARLEKIIIHPTRVSSHKVYLKLLIDDLCEFEPSTSLIITESNAEAFLRKPSAGNYEEIWQSSSFSRSTDVLGLVQSRNTNQLQFPSSLKNPSKHPFDSLKTPSKDPVDNFKSNLEALDLASNMISSNTKTGYNEKRTTHKSNSHLHSSRPSGNTYNGKRIPLKSHSQLPSSRPSGKPYHGERTPLKSHSQLHLSSPSSRSGRTSWTRRTTVWGSAGIGGVAGFAAIAKIFSGCRRRSNHNESVSEYDPASMEYDTN